MAVFRVVFRGLVADVVHCAIALIVLKRKVSERLE